MPAPWPVPAVALSPIALGSVVWRSGPAPAPVQRVTVLVKATFGFVHQGAARLLPPRALVREDRGYDGVLEEAAETAPYLPRAGVVLTGHAHAPGGRPAASVAVRLAVVRDRPLLDKTVHAFGHRATAGAAPEPFQRIRLGWERAAGGPGSEDNPSGVGDAPPSFQDPADPRRPAGFGPVPGHWGPRRRLLGALEAPAVADLPEGLDFRFFQAAPADQQVDFLRGDEWIVLDGVHPVLPRVQTRLPGARAEARWAVAGGPPRAVEMVADTLVIDADLQICALVWRGCFVLEEAPQACRIEAGLALPGRPVVWPEAAPSVVPANARPLDDDEALPTQGIVLADVVRAPLPFRPPDDEELAARTGAVDLAKLAIRPLAPFAVAAPGSGAAPVGALPGAPWSVAAEPPPIPDEAFATRAVVLPGTAAVPVVPVAPGAALRERVTALLAAGEALAGLDLRDVDLRGIDFTRGALAGGSLAGANLRGCVLREARLADADLSGADLTDADFGGCDLARANLSGAMLAGVSFAAASLPEANLSATRGPGASFARARLSGADLRQARLPDASFEGADLWGVKAQKADLSRGRFAGADLGGADLRMARLKGANLAGAVLEAADLRDADLERADLTGATRRTAKMDGANLKDVVGAEA